MPSNDLAQRFDDILENIGRIHRYTEAMDETGFLEDAKTIDAVERCFERIAEAFRKLGNRFDADYPTLDLPALRGFGNVHRHDYDSVQPVLLWGSVRERLAHLEAMARMERKRLSAE